MLHKRLTLSALLATTFFSSGAAIACESDDMLRTEYGFVFKVVAGSDKIKTYTDPSATTEAYEMELLQPYFVVCEEGDFYKVTDLPADTVEEAESGAIGFVRADQVYQWTTREALSFSEIAFMEERPEIVAWDNEAILNKFMETGDKKTNPPAFQEDLESTLVREGARRPYPVLGSDVRKLRGVADKRVYNVLLPTAITPEGVIDGIDVDDIEKVERALKSATFVVVFDATGSMENFALETAKAINKGLSALDKEVYEASSMGFVFYRDEDDPEKLVSVAPMPLADAARALEKAAAHMTGGGDIAEPVLDAVYYAGNLYDWGQAGKRIVFAVLNGDAKPRTTGKIEQRVPADQDTMSIVRGLYENKIPVITVQASADEGPNLRPVLSGLAEETGGSFIKYGAGLSDREITEKVELHLVAEAVESYEAGEEVLGEMTITSDAVSIPLRVLDGEMLERLRTAGIDFNINPSEGGLLVREGYMLENNDLLSPQIQIDKDTLVNLVNLYSVLATTGVDTEAMLLSISEAIAAIAGEDYDPEDTIEEVIEKKLGIQFRSDLLNFDIAFLEAMTPAERLAMTKRIQEASKSLSQYLEANQAKFDDQIAVWMPVAALP